MASLLTPADHATRPFEADAIAAVLEDRQRVSAVSRVAAISDAARPAFDRLTQLATSVLGVPSATVTLVHEDCQSFMSETSKGRVLGPAEKSAVPLSASFCKHTVVMQRPFVVEDARKHEFLRFNDAVADGVVAYAGVPLVDPHGAVVGSLCAHDSKPRRWTDKDIAVLRGLAEGISTEIALREDIALREEAEQLVRSSEGRFRAMFESSPEGIAIVGLQSRTVARANPTFAALHGYEVAELVGLLSSAMIHPDDIEVLRADWEAMSAHERPVLNAEIRRLRKDGTEFWGAMSVSMLPPDEGVEQAIMYVRDVSERRANERELAYQAQHDSLTGLANRRSFDAELERVTSHARRYDEQAALILLDLDNFKAVNDSFGHAAGDELLCAVAGAMRESLRGTDIVARLGGDEFAAILHHVDGDAASPIADKLLAAVAEAGVGSGAESGVTASVGIADIGSRPDASVDELLASADAALYVSKEGGRNKATVSSFGDAESHQG